MDNLFTDTEKKVYLARLGYIVTDLEVILGYPGTHKKVPISIAYKPNAYTEESINKCYHIHAVHNVFKHELDLCVKRFLIKNILTLG